MESTIVVSTADNGVVAKESPILAWHFRRADGTTEYLRVPETIGEWQEMDGEITPCRRGFHASVNPLDGLGYAAGFLVCRVECAGTIVHYEDGDKLACSARRVLWQADGKNAILLFAAECAEQALLREREAGREPDERSWAAIEAVRKFVSGEITAYDATDAARAVRAAAYAAYDAARAVRAAAYAADAGIKEQQSIRLTEVLLALEPK